MQLKTILANISTSSMSETANHLDTRLFFNPLKDRGVNWLHYAIQVQPRFLISDIRALWCSALSARVPECQKLKI